MDQSQHDAAKKGHGPVVKAASGSAPVASGKRDGEFVEMQDLLPVIATFREHLETEQRRNRTRLAVLGVAAVVGMGIMAAVPMNMARVFVEQSQENLKAQRRTQEEIVNAVVASLDTLTAATKNLREELAAIRERNVSAPAAAVAPPVQVEASAPAPKPPPAPAPEKQPAAEPAPPVAVVAPAAKAAPPAAAAAPQTNRPVAAAVPPAAAATGATTQVAGAGKEDTNTFATGVSLTPVEFTGAPSADELEELLQQVEKAIADKKKELESASSDDTTHPGPR
jgi:hypothetical protein